MAIPLDEAVAIRSMFLGRRYPKRLVEEHEHCWYFPNDRFCIGPTGMIVSKADGHFHVPGGYPGEWRIWAHDHGFKHSLYDLRITRIFEKKATLAFLKRTGLSYVPFGNRRLSVPRPPLGWRAKQHITSATLAEPLTIRNVHLDFPVIREFYLLKNDLPFAYDLIVRSCPNHGCSKEDARAVLPPPRHSPLVISLREFLLLGKWGDIKLGDRKSDVARILGKPDPDCHSHWRISQEWYYDDFKVGFKNNRVNTIGFFAPTHFRVPPSMQFSDFLLSRKTTFSQLKSFASKCAVPFHETNREEIKCPSGVSIRVHTILKSVSLLLFKSRDS